VAGALAERLGHDAPGAQAVGGGERARALVAAPAVAGHERVEPGAHGGVVDRGQAAAAGDQAAARLAGGGNDLIGAMAKPSAGQPR
jgi:hypothetical protein